MTSMPRGSINSPPEMEPPQVPRDLAAKVLAAEKRNAIKDVGDGGTLPAPLRKEMQTAALTPDLAAQQRAGALLAKYCAGTDLTPAQWEEIRAAHPGFAGELPPPSTVAAIAPGAEQRTARLTKADEARYSALYGREWRQLRRWIEKGEKSGDACPLHDPAKMPAWWHRNMKWRLPSEIEAAAVEAARTPAAVPDPPPPQTALPASPPPVAAVPQIPAPNAALQASGGNKVIRLEDFDPEEGDRLRELKQLQAAKFDQLKTALELGQDTTALESKYIKLCETLDKIESRVIERMKKRGLYVLRDEVERDLAASAEFLRQTRESMQRRVLELCPSLSAEQKLEVSDAIVRARAKEDGILSKLDCLKTDDLLRELAA